MILGKIEEKHFGLLISFVATKKKIVMFASVELAIENTIVSIETLFVKPIEQRNFSILQ